MQDDFQLFSFQCFPTEILAIVILTVATAKLNIFHLMISSGPVSSHHSRTEHAFFKKGLNSWREWIKHQGFVYFFSSRGQMSDFQCFLRPMGALEDRRVRQISDLHRDCGVGIHHKQTSREFKIRLKHWGCLLRKPVCSSVIILPGKLWFNNLWPLRLRTQIEKTFLYHFSAGIFPCPEMFYIDVLVYSELCSLIRPDRRWVTFYWL